MGLKKVSRRRGKKIKGTSHQRRRKKGKEKLSDLFWRKRKIQFLLRREKGTPTRTKRTTLRSSRNELSPRTAVHKFSVII